MRSPNGSRPASGLALAAAGWFTALGVSIGVAAPPPSTTTTDQALKITGRIELPAGAARQGAPGAPGVEIQLHPAVEDFAAAARQLAGQPPPPPLAATHADGTGAFLLAAPGPGCYRVSVRAPGYLPVDLVLAPLFEDRELPPARLTAAAPLIARAVGPRGEPLAGIRLALQESGWRQGATPAQVPAWHPAERSGTTGPDGRLDLPLTATERPALTVYDPRFLGASMVVPEPPPTAGKSDRREAILRLAPHPALVIEARGSDGRPAGGALLRVGGRPVAIAGDDGRWALSFAGSEVTSWLGSPSVESPDGELLGETAWAKARGGVLHILLAPRREATGELVDAAGGAVARGLVWVSGTGRARPLVDQVLASAGADPAGRFRLRWPAGENRQLCAGAPGYVAAWVDTRRGPGPQRIVLARATDLAGMVVDRSGYAVAGARIETVEAGGGMGPAGLPAAVTSGPDGGFRIVGVAGGKQYQLAVAAPHYARLSTLVLVPVPMAGKPAVPVRIVMDPGRGIVGRLVSAAGEPLAGIAVTLVAASSRGLLGSIDGRDHPLQARSDARGAFELPSLAPARYDLEARGAGFAPTSRPGIDLLPAASPLDLGRLVMEAGAVCEGVVTDRRAQPLAGVQAELAAATPALTGSDSGAWRQGAPESATTGADGRFRIPDLPGPP